MNLSPSQNNLLKTLTITPLQVVMSNLHVSVHPAKPEPVIEQNLQLHANLLLDLQLLLPQLTAIILGENFALNTDTLRVPQGFNFDASGKKKLWQFIQQQISA